ncbi:hypothetical protein BCR39DRAFT_41625 [Naematelia encephala]|uniref:Uncharacterized protein n=1 Tax=Naematelia encephala TaxID=71784 RepID=A0A1Y2BDT2_9TREE|nr:hypothetical protein BCR39DRAFT_41625 [Naematelia encephala]
MTTLNPSHNPFRKPSGRHAQAVHEPASDFPDDLPISDDEDLGVDDERRKARREGKREARKRVRGAMPPLPDLRFEQSYLLSIRPFLKPRPNAATAAEKGPVPAEGAHTETKSLVASSDDDKVFHWGRQVDVDWGMVSWVTLRDQVLSPLVQGALWGWAALFLGATAAGLRGALYPATHVPRGRIVGGSGGSIEKAGGGEAVGGDGWWRKWVGSLAGGIQTATA